MIPFIGKHFFMFDYMLNFLIVSSIFTVIYSILLGFSNKRVFSIFIKDVKNEWKIIVALPLIWVIPFLMLKIFIGVISIMPFVYMSIVFFLVTLFWIYAKTIENNILKKEIQTKELKAGDVLENMNWVGLKKKEVEQIQKQKEKVIIKEGLRFIPVFFITFLVTIFYGNIFFIIMGF